MSKKRVDSNELGPGATDSSAVVLAMGSRTSSTNSLDTATTSSTSALHQSPIEALPSLSSLPLVRNTTDHIILENTQDCTFGKDAFT